MTKFLLNTFFSVLLFVAAFKSQAQFCSNLPVMKINSKGQTINDGTRVTADMQIEYNGVGGLNCDTAAGNHFIGQISIEYRGSTSQIFDKKPYGFSTLNSAGTADSSRVILTLPLEEDFTLLNVYNDKTYIRDVITHDLMRSLGWYSSRCVPVELFVNNSYEGVYILMEKIKVDKNRVDISKLQITHNAGDSLTGGYILKVDKTTGNSGPGFYSNITGFNIQYESPDWDIITSTQKSYIENYVHQFENVLTDTNSKNPYTGYRKYFNPYSFVDFFFLNEIANNIDGYRLSTYFYKDKDSKCGKLTMGPLWDFNLSFGNGNYCNGEYTNTWQYSQGCGEHTTEWFSRMLQDSFFTSVIKRRWTELRSKELSNASVIGRIDSYYNYLYAAHVRDSTRWNVIGQQIWPNAWWPNNWTSEYDSLKTWTISRLAWLDANMYGTLQTTPSNLPLVISEINYNSDSTRNADDWLELHNTSNATIDISGVTIFDGIELGKYCMLPQGLTIPPLGYLVIFSDSVRFTTMHPTVTNKYGPLCFKLSNGGQKIQLRDVNDLFITEVNYDDAPLWSWTPDGAGRTLEWIGNTSSNTNDSSLWVAGCIGGSPGAAYTSCNEPIVVSEVNYQSCASFDAGDWIELYNTSAAAIDLSGWLLGDVSPIGAYQFPTGTTIPSHGFLVIYKNALKFNFIHPGISNAIGPFSFGLSPTGDYIRLYNSQGVLQHSMAYQINAPWVNTAGSCYTLDNQSFGSNYSASQNLASTWAFGTILGTPGIGISGASALQFVETKASIENRNSVGVYWKVADASAVNNYEVLWKNANGIFEVVGTVNGSNNDNYKYVHTQPLRGINQYKILAVLHDGSMVTSKIAQVNFAYSDVAKLSPNPASTSIQLHLMDENFDKILIRNAMGVVVSRPSTSTISIQELPLGWYTAEVVYTDEVLHLSFLKQ